MTQLDIPQVDLVDLTAASQVQYVRVVWCMCACVCVCVICVVCAHCTVYDSQNIMRPTAAV